MGTLWLMLLYLAVTDFFFCWKVTCSCLEKITRDFGVDFSYIGPQTGIQTLYLISNEYTIFYLIPKAKFGFYSIVFTKSQHCSCYSNISMPCIFAHVIISPYWLFVMSKRLHAAVSVFLTAFLTQEKYLTAMFCSDQCE